MAYNLINTQKTLERFRDYVIQQSRTNLTKGDKNVTSELYTKLRGDVKAMPNSIGVYFEMPAYGQFQDKGVKGKLSSLKAPNSPFKFGSGTGKKGGLTEGINKWVKARRIQFKRKDGKFMSYESTAFMITRSIYNKGIRPSLFFTKPFEAGYKKYITEDLIKGFALDVEDLMKTSLKDIK
jgi:hypothetical protein